LKYVGASVQEELVTFWKRIFERDSSASLNNSWLSHLREKFVQDITLTELTLAITMDVLTTSLQNLRNWASPGPDRIQGFWQKRLSSSHNFLCKYFHHFLIGEEILPVWFPTGRTLLIPRIVIWQGPRTIGPSHVLTLFIRFELVVLPLFCPSIVSTIRLSILLRKGALGVSMDVVITFC